MSRYVYFQDGHYKGKNSINRLGDFSSDWLLKFDELLSIAKENKVDGILDGGDLLDGPEPSYRVLDEIADRVEKVNIPFYSLFGNHAQRYHSNEHSKYTGLAHLQKRSDLFKYFNEIQGKDFIIKGIEYNHNIEEILKEEGISFCNEDNWKVAIVHAFICPKEFPYASHIICDDIKTDADLILVAHYHSVWEKKVGNTQYLDIGCFGRNSITEAKIEPSCILLDTEKRSYEIIKLKSAKKGSEIFDLKKIAEIKDADQNMERFIKSLESVDFQGQDILSIIKSIAKEGNISSEVVDLIHSKIQEVN